MTEQHITSADVSDIGDVFDIEFDDADSHPTLVEGSTDLVVPSADDVKCNSSRKVTFAPETTIHATCDLSEGMHQMLQRHQVVRVVDDVTVTVAWDGDFE